MLVILLIICNHISHVKPFSNSRIMMDRGLSRLWRWTYPLPAFLVIRTLKDHAEECFAYMPFVRRILRISDFKERHEARRSHVTPRRMIGAVAAVYEGMTARTVRFPRELDPRRYPSALRSENVMTGVIPTTSPWRRLYESQGVAIHIRSAELQGSVPAQLRGVHYRVGPLGGRAYGLPLANAFADADGYACSYTFTDEGVQVRGDIVRTSVYEREHAAGRLLSSTFGTMPGMPLASRLATGIRGLRAYLPKLNEHQNAPVKDSPNHVACVVGGKLILIGGAGAPYALRTTDLTMLGPDNFGGALPPRQVYLLGESHLDPNSDERCFLEIVTYPPGLRLWSVGTNGHGRGSRRIPLPRVYMPHDFGLTESKIVVPAGPVYGSIPKLILANLGIGTLNEGFIWHGDKPTIYYVIDRQTHKVRTHYTRASYPVHVANAFDDGDDVVLDMNVHNNDAALRGFTAAVDHDAGHPDFVNRLYRTRLSADGRVIEDELAPFDCEAPYTNEVYNGRQSRYVYATVTARGIAGSQRIVKIDAETRQHWTFDYGPDCVTGQPVFVSRPGATAEDDGWVLCQVYNGVTNKSFLSIVRGDFSQEHCRVILPCALPYLLHGKFVHTGGPT